jgi:hypothetical protein
MANRTPWILIVCLLSLSLQRSCAAIACPVSLFDGKADRDGIALSFRNIGKLPIQQLVFGCASSKTPASQHPNCHEETGLFFPGTDYTSSFAYPGSAGSILVSLQSARLAGGSLWLAKRDQRCRPLRVVRKRKP